ncbi:hypothetical protein Hanom_Chr09g00851621 [Helianthus anomalus]
MLKIWYLSSINVCEVWALEFGLPALDLFQDGSLAWAYSRYVQMGCCLGLLCCLLGFARIKGGLVPWLIHSSISFSCSSFHCSLLYFPIFTSTFVSLGFYLHMYRSSG